MANPKIKIKTGTGKPSNWNGTSGATAGELYVDLSNTSFYIGNTFGRAITFGNLIDSDITLNANSNTRIPTQKAVKSYIDNNIQGSVSDVDLFMIRQIAVGDTYLSSGFLTEVTESEELSNSESSGSVGGVFLNNRWKTFQFNINHNLYDNEISNIYKSKFNSIFDFLSDSRIVQRSGSTVKAHASYQLTFDPFSNGNGGPNDPLAVTGRLRRAAIRVTTYTSPTTYQEKYFLLNSANCTFDTTTGDGFYVITSTNASGIIEIPPYVDESFEAGQGYIELVWGTTSELNTVGSGVGEFIYAGRSNMGMWAQAYYTSINLSGTLRAGLTHGYCNRLSLVKI
jgi:hypothetical protein